MSFKTRVNLLKLQFKNFLFAPLCVVRNCSKTATHAVHISIMTGDFLMGRFLPICENEQCFEEIGKVENSDHVTRAPLDTLIAMGRQSGQRLGMLRMLRIL